MTDTYVTCFYVISYQIKNRSVVHWFWFKNQNRYKTTFILIFKSKSVNDRSNRSLDGFSQLNEMQYVFDSPDASYIFQRDSECISFAKHWSLFSRLKSSLRIFLLEVDPGTHNNVPHNNVPHNIVPQNNVPHNIVPQNNVPHNIVPQNNVPHKAHNCTCWEKVSKKVS